MRKRKKVLFIPRDKEIQDLGLHPKPAKNYIPDWYKKMPNLHVSAQKEESPTGKKCVPFLDSFLSGYMYELPCDVRIIYLGRDPNTSEDLLRYEWYGQVKPMSTRLEVFGTPNTFPKFSGFYHAEFHWNSLWEPETPEGYSTIYQHPHNRFDLPFQTMTGIIDTDRWSVPGPVPFLIKEGFEGIIPAGTPIIQTTFIKREKWSSDSKEYDAIDDKRKRFSVRKYFMGGYKKYYWQKKEYF